MLSLALALSVSSAGASAPSLVTVSVLTHAVNRGDPLSATDFDTEQRPAVAARGAIDARAATGMEARRRLAAGSIVRASDIAPAQVVRRGEPVVISYRTGTLSISTPGKALSNGAVGDPVRVVSLATNHTLDATVEGAGTVLLRGR